MDDNKKIIELLKLLSKQPSSQQLVYQLSDYHESDIAQAFEALSENEQKWLITIFIQNKLYGVFSYMDNLHDYLEQLPSDHIAMVLSGMDSQDVVDVLEQMTPDIQNKVVAMLDKDISEDIQLILSYEEDEVGSKMTTNYIVIHNECSILEAMQSLRVQAGINDNIGTIYVTDQKNQFYGAIDLKDLIIAKDYMLLDSLIIKSYPYFRDHDKIADCIEQMKDYAEDSLPVLNDKHELIGIITSQDIIEVVDDEYGEDYAKLAGLTSQEDLQERILDSMKKRLPWLIALLFLGIGVSGVVGIFESVVASLPIIICFQSLILDMAGNVGTQSLAVTIRVLMDEEINGKEKGKLVLKEVRVGFSNGLFLGILSFMFVGLYNYIIKGLPLTHAYLISSCVGISLLLAMTISSLVGTIIPLFFHKMQIDPAVASGPLITTVNDLVAVITYYGLAWLLLIQVVGMG